MSCYALHWSPLHTTHLRNLHGSQESEIKTKTLILRQNLFIPASSVYPLQAIHLWTLCCRHDSCHKLPSRIHLRSPAVFAAGLFAGWRCHDCDSYTMGTSQNQGLLAGRKGMIREYGDPYYGSYWDLCEKYHCGYTT